MSKLNDQQKREYCERHIPYMHGVMLGHFLLKEQGFQGDEAIWNAAFLGSLIAGRQILEFLGIVLSRPPLMELKQPKKKWDDSVYIEDIGGEPVDLGVLHNDPDKYTYICEYIKMANKAGGHITIAEERPLNDFHPMVKLIDQMLENQMETLPEHLRQVWKNTRWRGIAKRIPPFQLARGDAKT